jgi:hypothetical protein
MNPSKRTAEEFKIALGRLKILDDGDFWVIETKLDLKVREVRIAKSYFKFYATRSSDPVEKIALQNRQAAQKVLIDLLEDFHLQVTIASAPNNELKRNFGDLFDKKSLAFSSLMMFLILVATKMAHTRIYVGIILMIITLLYYKMKTWKVLLIAVFYSIVAFGINLVFDPEGKSTIWSLVTGSWLLLILFFGQLSEHLIVRIIQDVVYILTLVTISNPFESLQNSVLFVMSICMAIWQACAGFKFSNSNFMYFQVMLVILLFLGVVSVVVISPDLIYMLPPTAMICAMSIQNSSSRDPRRLFLGLPLLGL